MAFGQSSPKVTLHSELQSFLDLSLLPAYRTNTVQEEQTTYDRLGGNNDGFAGTWSFIRRNPDSSLVMLDIDGPGVINRIATPTATNDTLDFYIDNMNTPVWSICYRDLFTGNRYPFTGPLCGNAVGGYYCYFPVLFQSHCRIVCRGKRLQFHQIGYRLFAAGTPVESFSGRLTKGEKNDLARIAAYGKTRQKCERGEN